jgi:hypothetical protein
MVALRIKWPHVELGRRGLAGSEALKRYLKLPETVGEEKPKGEPIGGGAVQTD